MGAGVGERTDLADGLALDGAKVGEGIAAGVVVVGITANVAGEVEDGVDADGVGVGGRDVEGADFGALVSIADAAEDGVRAGAAADDILDVEVVEGVRRLEPGAADAEVDVEGVGWGKLTVNAVKDIELVAFVVEDGELGRVEEAAGVEPVEFDEVAPVLVAVAEVDGSGGRAEGAVGGGD